MSKIKCEKKKMTEKEQTLYDLFNFKVSDVNYLINISDKYKYIYFETPKVGCSTIKSTLQKLEVDDESKLPDSVHHKHLSPLKSPLDLENNFTEYLNDEYFKFSFVRNPYTRILSCYLDKIVGYQNVTLPELGFKPTDELSFKDFLLAVKKQSYAQMNPHWKPQSILLAAENITLDFIGRQENFDNDLKLVISKITHIEPGSATIVNERPHAVGANEKLKKYITKEIAELIYEIYYNDFVLYGYDRDPFSNKPLAPVKIEKSSTEIFFLIPTCEKYSHKADAIRNTWGKDLHKFGFKYLFLMGRPELKQAMIYGDTLYVACEDNYESLLLKLILGYEYLYEHFEFNYVYKIDDDCFLDIVKFQTTICPQMHSQKYFGGKVNPKDSKLDTKWHFGKCAHSHFEKPFSQDKVPFDYALGGFGYLLHKEVLPTLTAHKNEFKKELETYVYSYEDLKIGEILYHHQIVPIQLENYTTLSASDYIGSTHCLVYDIEDPQLMFKIEKDLEDQRPPTLMKQIESSMVSVIVPAFNEEKNIARCLDSIINQTYQNIEVIVVNDASTDNTRNVVEKYIQMDQRITCIDKEKNAGLLQARMTGIKNAKGVYIYSVDSDDYVMPDLINDTLVEAFKHNADIVQFPMMIVEKDRKYSHNWTKKKYEEYDKNNFFLHNTNSCTIMFKKDLGDILWKYIGSLPLNYHEDYIISIILSAFYKKVRYIDTAYYVYCDTDTSMTRQYSDDAILEYVRDTLIFTRFMTDVIPIIFPNENTKYLLTVLSNRINLMKHQLNLYFKNSKNVNIYNLYNKTDKNKIFIFNSMLYETIQLKDTQLIQQETQLIQLKQKLPHKDQYLKQQETQLIQLNQKLRQKDQYLKQQQSRINTLVNNRWYRFGLMSNKRKIWTIGKVVSKKIKLYWLLHPMAKFIKKILGK